MGRSLQDRAFHRGVLDGVASCAELVDVFEHDDAGLHRYAEQRQHADARGYAQVSSGDQQRQKAADAGQADVQQDEQRPFVGAKHGVENDEDHQDCQRNDDRQPRFRPLFALVFARPADGIARRQFHFLTDLL